MCNKTYVQALSTEHGSSIKLHNMFLILLKLDKEHLNLSLGNWKYPTWPR